MKVVFVCTGNTCRSPMMAAMFRDYAKKVGFDCEVDCAGMTGGGSPVNPKAAHSLAARGLSADDRLSRVFGEGEKDADFVFTMTDAQRDELRTRHPRPFCREPLPLCGRRHRGPLRRHAGGLRRRGGHLRGRPRQSARFHTFSCRIGIIQTSLGAILFGAFAQPKLANMYTIACVPPVQNHPKISCSEVRAVRHSRFLAEQFWGPRVKIYDFQLG